MTATSNALHQVGVDLGVDAGSNLIGAITDYNKQNLSPEQLASANAGLRVLATATGIGALVPGVVRRGVAGEWESTHYANDLNSHHPKFKFLFKVNFKGFPGGDNPNGNFSYFIHRCDKPKVRFNHVDVNYYNFRTKVLTSVAYDPLTFTFLDEIGNSVNKFFTEYLFERSRQGDGLASIIGGDQYSSSVHYPNGYSSGQSIEIQQIFANGLATNIFTLINPRIDALEFDELAMEQTAGSMLTCTVSYDAITCRTTGSSTINSWGQTDLYRGGGTSGEENAGQASINQNGTVAPSSASGGGIGGETSFISKASSSVMSLAAAGVAALGAVPKSLSDLVTIPSLDLKNVFSQPFVVPSNSDILSNEIQGTLTKISSGQNMTFRGSADTGISSIPSSVGEVIATATPAFAAANNGSGIRDGQNPNIDDATRARAAAWVASRNP